MANEREKWDKVYEVVYEVQEMLMEQLGGPDATKLCLELSDALSNVDPYYDEVVNDG